MKNIIREYFYYNKLERNGVFVLVLLCLLVLFYPNLYKSLSSKSASTDFSSFKSEIEAFESNKITDEISNPEKIKTELFLFDPNTVSQEDLKRLGFSEKVIRTLNNFRNKGGKFFKKEDFKKIYGISEEDYTTLENFIEIKPANKYNENFQKENINNERKVVIEPFEFDPNSASKEDLLNLGFSKRAANNLLKFRAKGGQIYKKENLSKIYGVDEKLYNKLYPFITLEKREDKLEVQEPKEFKTTSSFSKPEITLDINSATIDDWQQLNGIGPFYAKKIVNFRKKLGGFYAVDQIKETYGLPDSTFQKIFPQLKYNLSHQKIKLNIISLKELANHPYIKYQQAKVIINYREQHGAFKNIKDLNKIIILTPEFIKKIEPYLSFE